MGLFSKEECCFCNNNVGILGRKKMQDKNYICKDCEMNTSAFIDISKFTKEFAEENMEYMKKQDELYKKEYEPLSKEEKERYVCVEQGIVFADSIGMFEILSPRAKKRNYRELFRYDQIESYEKYEVENTNQEQSRYKYSEVGVIIKMKCKIGMKALGQTETYLKNAHPYVEEFKIKLSNETDSGIECKSVINHLDRIFMKEESYKSFGQDLKESIFGTKTEQRHMKEGIEDIKNLAGMFSAKMSGDEEKMAQAKENIINSSISNMAEGFGACDPKYTEMANQAENRAWGNE